MKFSLDHPYKYNWAIIKDPHILSILSDLKNQSSVKGLADVTNHLQCNQTKGLLIVNKNAEAASLFQHFPILTFLNNSDNLLCAVSEGWPELAYFILDTDIDGQSWIKLQELGKISLPIGAQVKYVPIE